MAIARVQAAAGNTPNTAAVTATLGATATANNLLVAFHSNRGVETPGTPLGWTQTATVDGDNTATMFHKVSDGTETGITVSLLLAAEQTVSLIEYSGTATTSPLDGAVTNASNAFASSFATANLTTTNANDVLVAGLGLSGTPDGTISWDSSFVAVTQQQSSGGASSNASAQGTAERIVAATATYSTTASWTTGRRKTTILAAFKAAAGAAPQTVSPSAITSAEAFGAATITPGAVSVSPTGIATAEAFGTAQLNLTVSPVGVATSEAFGTPVLTVEGGTQFISPVGILSAETFGTPILSQPPPQTISPAGIASTETVGTPTILGGALPEDVLAAWRIIEIQGAANVTVRYVPSPRPGAKRT